MTDTTDRRERNLATLRAAFDAIARGDADELVTHYAEDYVLELPYSDPDAPKVVRGRAAVRDYLSAAFGVFRFSLDDLEVPSDGEWLIQVVYGNGAASVTTGITCGHLRVRVLDEAGGEAGRGYLPLPHTGDWATWRDSGFVAVRLRAGSRYRVVLDGQEHAYNMSIFEHFRRYTGGPGGADGVFNRANISALKLLGR